MSTKQSRESGVVSLLSVIFFMVFMSVLVIGFLRIVSDEQRQSTSSDLSASALAAARTGIEDGKRILLYCRAHPAAPGCVQFMSDANAGCDAIKNDTSFLSTVAIDKPSPDSAEARATSSSGYDQYYRCLQIRTATAIVTKQLSEGQSILIPLDAVGQLSRLKLEWHINDSAVSGGDGIISPTTLPSTITDVQLPARDSWQGKPALLRTELIRYAPGAITLDDLDANAKTAFLYPSKSRSAALYVGSPASTIDYATLDNRLQANTTPTVMRNGGTPQAALCGEQLGDYSCSKTIARLDAAPASVSDKYYLRLTAIYRGTHVRLSLADSGGQSINFDNVQPVIEATGRVANTYRRVAASVTYSADYFSPEFAVASSDGLCKIIERKQNAPSEFVTRCP